MKKLTEVGTEIMSFGRLLENRNLIIPGYQREYRWHPGQVRTFVEDGIRLIGVEGEARYYGSATLHGERGGLEGHVVDGQQRITTTLLTLVALGEILEGVVEHVELSERIWRCVRGAGPDGTIRARIRSKHPTVNDVLTAIVTGGDLEGFSEVPARNYIEALDVVRGTLATRLKGVDGTFDVARVASFAKGFLENAGVVVAFAPDLPSAIEMYIKQHESVSPLGDSDILKGRLFDLVAADDRDRYIELYHEMQTILWRVGGSAERTLIHILRGMKGVNEVTQKKDLMRRVVEQAQQEGVIQFLEKRLLRAARALEAGIAGNHPSGRPCPPLRDIMNVQRLERFSTTRSLIAAAVDLDEEARDRLFFHLRSTLTVLSIGRSSPPKNERTFIEWSQKTSEGEVEEVIALMREHRRIHAQDYARNFHLLGLKNSPSNLGANGVRYLLGLAEGFVEGKILRRNGTGPSTLSLSEGSDIEHIMPQSLAGVTGVSEPQRKLHLLGNLTLLESTRNQSVKDGDHPSKLTEYALSNHYLTSSIAQSIAGQGKANGAAQAASRLRTFLVWDDAAIEDRTDMLYSIITEALDIPGAPDRPDRAAAADGEPVPVPQARPENTVQVLELLGEGVVTKEQIAVRLGGDGASHRQLDYCLEHLEVLGLAEGGGDADSTGSEQPCLLTDAGRDLLAEGLSSEEIALRLREAYAAVVSTMPQGEELALLLNGRVDAGQAERIVERLRPDLARSTRGHRATALRAWADLGRQGRVEQ